MGSGSAQVCFNLLRLAPAQPRCFLLGLALAQLSSSFLQVCSGLAQVGSSLPIRKICASPKLLNKKLFVRFNSGLVQLASALAQLSSGLLQLRSGLVQLGVGFSGLVQITFRFCQAGLRFCSVCSGLLQLNPGVFSWTGLCFSLAQVRFSFV